MPRVVIGLPMYAAEEFLRGVIESLLNQDYDDFAIVAVDDASPDSTLAIAREYARSDPRLVVESNAERLGMIGNWNRVLSKAKELHGDFEFFAWASDNDLRDASWISVLVRALDEDPTAIMAYSRFGVIKDGEPVTPEKWQFETRGIESARARLKATVDGLRAGPVMYGLHRVTNLHSEGVPSVLLSDVLFLSHLSLYGTFIQEQGPVWYRGDRKTGGKKSRQRAALFVRAPISTYLPYWMQHAFWLVKAIVFGERRPPGMGRFAALQLVWVYVWKWCLRVVKRQILARRKGLYRRLKQRRKRQTARERSVRVKTEEAIPGATTMTRPDSKAKGPNRG